MHDISYRTIENENISYNGGYLYWNSNLGDWENGNSVEIEYYEKCSICDKKLKTFKSKKKALKREIEIKQEQLKKVK